MFVAALCESGLCRLLYNRISIEFANKPVHAPNDNAIKNQSIHYHYSSNRTVLIVGCLLQTHLSLNNFIDQVTSFEQPLLSQVLYTMHRLLTIGANRPETSGTVTDFLPVSRVPHGSLLCPGNKTNSSDLCI